MQLLFWKQAVVEKACTNKIMTTDTQFQWYAYLFINLDHLWKNKYEFNWIYDL